MNVQEEQSKSPPWPYSAAFLPPLLQAEAKPPPKRYSESAAQNKGALGSSFKSPPPPRGDRMPP
eukprot:10311589-Karenia_brevis.AAC.1